MADISKTSEQSLNNILNKLGVRTQEEAKHEEKSFRTQRSKTSTDNSSFSRITCGTAKMEHV